jgi:hypothetical protein
MTFNAHETQINFADEDYPTIDVFWNEDVDGNHYTENGVVDNDCGENKIRCDAIEQTRNKYLAEKKLGHDYYEKHSLCTYKSLDDYRKCFKEIEEKGLCINAEPRTPFEETQRSVS